MRAFLAAATFLLIVPVAHADYKVGDHLAKPKKEIAAEGPFKTTGWDALLPKFVKVFPHEFKRVLGVPRKAVAAHG